LYIFEGEHKVKISIEEEDNIEFEWEETHCGETDTESTQSILAKDLFVFLNNKYEYEAKIYRKLEKELKTKFANKFEEMKVLKIELKKKDSKIQKLEDDLKSIRKAIRLLKN